MSKTIVLHDLDVLAAAATRVEAAALAQQRQDLLTAWQAPTEAEQYDEAIARYRALTAQHPDVAAYWFDLAHCLAQRQQNTEALAALERGLALDPENRLGLLNATIVLELMGRYADMLAMAARALIAYDAYLATNPGDARAWSAKGQVLRDLQRYSEALVACEQAERLGSHYAYVTHVTIFARLEQYEEALDVIDQALALVPATDAFVLATLWSEKSSVLYRLHRGAEALTASDVVLTLPTPPPIAGQSTFYAQRATIFAALGRPDDALAAIDTALVIALERIGLQLTRASLLDRFDRSDDAEVAFTQILADAPRHPDVLTFWFAHLERVGRYAEAVSVFEQVREQNPTALRVWDWITAGHAYSVLGQDETALEVMEHAHALRVTYRNSFTMAAVLWRLHREDEAAEMDRQALDLWEAENVAHPDNRRLWWEKPVLYFHLGRLDEALAAITAAQQHIPDLNLVAIHSIVLVALGRYDDVLAMTTPEPDAGLLVGQSRALRHLGRLDEARATLDQALQSDPKDVDALSDFAKFYPDAAVR